MGLFTKDKSDVEEFDTVEDAVVSHDEQEVIEEVVVEETVDLGSVEESNKRNNEALAGDGPTEGLSVEEPFRKDDESQAEYNERVPVAVQPVLDGPALSYLGEPL